MSATILAPRLWRMLILPVLTLCLIEYTTEDRALILVLNIVQVGMAVAVVVAFSSELKRILLTREPMTRGCYIAFGIWMGWGSIVWRTAESLVWRILGQPSWLINSDVTSTYLAMGIYGAACHIIKPGEVDDRIPPKEAVRIGLIVGALTIIGLGILYAPEICAAWHPHSTEIHDSMPLRMVG